MILSMSSSTFVWIRILCFFILTVSVSIRPVEPLPSGSPDENDGRVGRLTVTKKPQNVAAVVGSTVVLECEVDQAPPVTRVMWVEFATNKAGEVISDNDNIIERHPNSARYKLMHTTPTEFNLEIRDLQLSDGGTYRCMDTLSSPPNDYVGEAQLIVLEPAPVCTSPMTYNGVVFEGGTYTAECAWRFQGKYPPTMTWSVPPPYRLVQSSSNSTSVWSKIEFNAEISKNGIAYKLATYFKEVTYDPPPDTSSHVPTWESIYSFPLVVVNWEPRNVYIEPLKKRYYVGETLTCHAYANPTPFYQWLNTRTLESVSGQTFTITQSMVGYNQTLLCQAQNFIIDNLYSAQALVDVFVQGS